MSYDVGLGDKMLSKLVDRLDVVRSYKHHLNHFWTIT